MIPRATVSMVQCQPMQRDLEKILGLTQLSGSLANIPEVHVAIYC